MRNLILLGTALILLGCKENPYTEVELNPIHNTYSDEVDTYYQYNRDKYSDSSQTKSEVIKSTVTIHYGNGESKTVNTNPTQSENSNKARYSTEGIEYSEEWRIKAYKATEEYLIRKFPTDNKGCRITNVGYYRTHNVKYIGSHSFQVKIYIIFKCNKDSYRHKKNLWMEAYYWDDDNSFGFSLIKDRYVD
jgi:hypothetical protein